MTIRRLPFSRYWSIDETAMDALIVRLRSAAVNWSLITERGAVASESHQSGDTLQLSGDTAVISLIGETVKYPLPGFLMEILGLTSTITFQNDLRQAVADEAVKRIIVFVDSPGGEAKGNADAADALFAARSSGKEIVSYVSGLCASSAYFIASQAQRIVGNSEAIVGCIGTYMVVDDWSQFFEDAGVKRHVVRAGQFKGAGTTGTEISDEQLAEFQRTVNALSDIFVAAIARGRGFGMTTAKALNDGRVHVGQEAVRMKLIDAVQSWEQTLADGASAGKSKGFRAAAVAAGESAGDSPPNEGELTMSGETTGAGSSAAAALKSSAATVAELKLALPDSNAEFRETCTEASMTVGQAKDSWMVKLREQCAASDAARVSAEKGKAESDAQLKLAATGGGQPVLGSGGGGPTGESDAATDPIAAFEGAVAEKMKAGMPKHLATRAVCNEQVELRESYVEAMNLRKVG